ncbi:MAG: glycosyltransferase family 4 protein [Wenzhouxiangella sp.]
MSQALSFIVPGDPDQRTGGYLYDRRIAEELRRMGWSVAVMGLAGQFPLADHRASQAMDAALGALNDGAAVVIDGLALGAVPEAVAAHAERLDLSALVHHPLADETGLAEADRAHLLHSERQALSLCRRIIVTSTFTAQRLQALGLSDKAACVVEPGVEAQALAPVAVARLNDASEPDEERLLCVASLTPRKGQDVLVDALANLPRKGWHCRLSGSDQRQPDFAARLKAQIERLNLAASVELAGERDEAQLAADYAWATVCVLPSHYEGYGMVVSEALARGLPMICTSGGALADTLPAGAGLQVPPNNAAALRIAVQRWLSEPKLRRELTGGAARARAALPSWADSARRFSQVLHSGGTSP